VLNGMKSVTPSAGLTLLKGWNIWSFMYSFFAVKLTFNREDARKTKNRQNQPNVEGKNQLVETKPKAQQF
jgi:hypothetical protein